ncbi:MAG TPA: D-Ala-D-Ala carboxypeptidase family metallohydrolase [Ignavibacteriaceae bacterium]|nr:D-Ala-D-Ala carboxypeptidase family metallohydrolase [Ignavibacteriaceae bacterium]
MLENLQNKLNYYKIDNFTMNEITLGRKIPKQLLWNIVPTIRVLQELRNWYNKPIIINSSYRSPAYNKLVGGSKNSLHLDFNAIDFTVKDRDDLKELFLQLDKWDKEYYFQFLPKAGAMGIGFYKDRFIHLDTRATLKRISPARWSE